MIRAKKEAGENPAFLYLTNIFTCYNIVITLTVNFYMKTQKIIKVGNSLAVTLPASFVRDGNMKVGDEVVVETMVAYSAILIMLKKNTNKNHLNPEFFQWLERTTKKHFSLIKELAKMP